jgi:hypothetical protein
MGQKYFMHIMLLQGNFFVTNFTVVAEKVRMFTPVGKKYKTVTMFKKGKHLPFFTLTTYEEAKLM